MSGTFGVVIIGRNEGARLRACLRSLRDPQPRMVYVDSGSSDDSVAQARQSGAQVVNLDLSRPFTAARARNEGFNALLQGSPGLDYVFFVDGDCEVAPDWPRTAATFLDEHPAVAVAWGLRRERFPDASIYNMLCDLEWQQASPGETRACGGDAMMRVSALRQAGGYRADMIAGEEPELCVRLRQAGWRIWHLPAAMTVHDAAMLRFHQWWRRSLRAGYAFALGAHLHGGPPERHWVAESRRAWIWGLGIPLVIAAAMAVVGAWGALLLLIYPLQVLRLGARGTRSARQNWWQALFLVLGRFPEMLGQVKFLRDRLRGAQARLIEYK